MLVVIPFISIGPWTNVFYHQRWWTSGRENQWFFPHESLLNFFSWPCTGGLKKRNKDLTFRNGFNSVWLDNNDLYSQTARIYFIMIPLLLDNKEQMLITITINHIITGVNFTASKVHEPLRPWPQQNWISSFFGKHS